MDASIRHALESYETYLVERNQSMGCLVAITHPFVLFVNEEIPVASYNYADVVPWSAMPSRERIKEVMAYYRTLSYGPHFNFTRETALEGLPEALREAGCALESRKYVMFQREPLDPPVPATCVWAKRGLRTCGLPGAS